MRITPAAKPCARHEYQPDNLFNPLPFPVEENSMSSWKSVGFEKHPLNRGGGEYIALLGAGFLAMGLMTGCSVVPKNNASSAAANSQQSGRGGAEPAALLSAQSTGAGTVSRRSAGFTMPRSGPAAKDCSIGSPQREELLREINRLRFSGASCGAKGRFRPTTAVSWNSKLETVSAGHARSMASHDFFSHSGLDGRNGGYRLAGSGYQWTRWAENIAAGQNTVPEVVSAWTESDGHCANLMNPGVREVGVACVKSSSAHFGTYWVLVMATAK
jgi:uncharacterized protein YkwD